MISYTAVSLFGCAFFLILSVLSFWWAKKSSSKEKPFYGGFVLAYVLFFLCVLLFWSSFQLSITDNLSAPCENLLMNETTYYKYGANYSSYHWDYQSPEITCNPSNPIDCVKVFHETTTYTYADSCADKTPNAVIEVFFVILSVAILLMFFFAVGAPVWFVLKWLVGKI